MSLRQILASEGLSTRSATETEIGTVWELAPMSGNRLFVAYRVGGRNDSNIVHARNLSRLKEGDKIRVYGNGRIKLDSEGYVEKV